MMNRFLFRSIFPVMLVALLAQVGPFAESNVWAAHTALKKKCPSLMTSFKEFLFGKKPVPEELTWLPGSGSIDLSKHATGRERQAADELRSRFSYQENYVLNCPKNCPLNSSEFTAIQAFTAEEGQEINRALRRKDVDLLHRYQDIIITMSSGYRKLPAFEGVTYRYTELAKPALSAFKTGTTYTEREFMRAFKEPQAGVKGNVEFRIHSDRGRDIRAYSRYKKEEDIVFFPTRFRVVGTSQQNGRTVIDIEDLARLSEAK